MAKLKSYKVKLAKGFPAEARHSRAGLTLQSNETVVVELTPDQVKDIQDDRYMDIVEDTGEEADQSSNGGEGEDSSDTTGEGNEADGPSEDEGDASQDASSQEEAGSEAEGSEESTSQEGDPEAGSDSQDDQSDEEAAALPTVEQLLKDNNRDALVAQATEANIALDFDNTQVTTKKVIAEAIVAARG